MLCLNNLYLKMANSKMKWENKSGKYLKYYRIGKRLRNKHLKHRGGKYRQTYHKEAYKTTESVETLQFQRNPERNTMQAVKHHNNGWIKLPIQSVLSIAQGLIFQLSNYWHSVLHNRNKLFHARDASVGSAYRILQKYYCSHSDKEKKYLRHHFLV